MKKIISLTCILFMLTGCVNNKDIDIYNELSEVVSLEEEKTYDVRNNNFTDYVDYYLPSDMSEIDSDFTTFSFKYNDSIIVYNINIADLINQKYYQEQTLKDRGYFYDNNYLFFEHQGKINTLNRDSDYIVRVYEIENEYLLSFCDIDSMIFAYANKGDVKEVLRHIFILAKMSRVEEDKVISSFSDKDVISATKKTISLFNYVYPSNGYLSDLMTSPIDNIDDNVQNNNDEDVYQEEIDQEEFEDNDNSKDFEDEE